MNNKTSCSIVLAQTGRSFYLPGEIISGGIILTVDTSINIKYVQLTIMGQVIYEYQMKPTVYTAATTNTKIKNFFVETQPLYVPLTDGITYDEDGYHIQPNTYKWPFSIHLPQILAPTLAHVGFRIPYIAYFLRVNISRSWFHRNIRSKRCIIVGNQVPRPPNVWPLESEGSNCTKLHIHGRLLRNYQLIRDPYITLELKIQNPNKTIIETATAKLIQCRQSLGYGGRVIIFKQPLPNIVDFQNVHLNQIFQIPVDPTILFSVPTVGYTYSNNSKKNLSVAYVLEVKFKTELLSTNVTLKFPLFVANSEPLVEAGI